MEIYCTILMWEKLIKLNFKIKKIKLYYGLTWTVFSMQNVWNIVSSWNEIKYMSLNIY